LPSRKIIPSVSSLSITSIVKRVGEGKKINTKYPTKIPVIIEKRAEDVTVPELDQNK
jgi:hypothetical protein